MFLFTSVFCFILTDKLRDGKEEGQSHLLFLETPWP